MAFNSNIDSDSCLYESDVDDYNIIQIHQIQIPPCFVFDTKTGLCLYKSMKQKKFVLSKKCETCKFKI